MTILLCRPTLSLTSGAGQLMRAQAVGLRAAGRKVELCCRRGAFSFFLTTGLRARGIDPAKLESLAARAGILLVDHGMHLRFADVVFVHNLLSEAARHVARDDWRAGAEQEAELFRSIDRSALVIANSNLVRGALLEHFGLDPKRVLVERPGFRSDRYNPATKARYRSAARRSLRLHSRTPLVGFVTSGDFRKRGLDLFLAAAEAIAEGRADARFLVVGSKRLPDWAARHPLVEDGRLLYRPKSTHPMRWFAALDVFLYPARFEEFGLVVSEALASGLPVLTSRRVGASECLPAEYGPWLLDAPDAAGFAERALALLADPALRARLGEAGASSVAPFDEARYVRATVGLMIERARAKAARRG
ncbi:MAG TPA: glycosyltransferase family 4 protein [Gammaproteobacteria bacterium]|nr:glycosyltransferase family 4 protein [Gammaproteobacteria bacterium]